MYRAPSGALVFGAGSVQWTWGLDETHDSPYSPEPADPRMQQAQVNLFADMGVQPLTLMPGLVPATPSADTTGPTTQIATPSAGSTQANGTNVTVTGTASDAAGRVASVEVSTDGGGSWHPAEGTTSWSYTYLQRGQGPQTIRVRAIDDSANIGSADTRNVTSTCPCSVFGVQVPATPDSTDPSAVEVGLRFTPIADGFATGVRFYKSAADTGNHVGNLWDATGQRLATVAFQQETATGWQSASFGSPVALSAGATYIVSYTAPQGHYAAQNGAFYAHGIDADPLMVDGGFGTDPAGVYGAPGTFPSASYKRGNYFVDLLFTSSDGSPLIATNHGRCRARAASR